MRLSTVDWLKGIQGSVHMGLVEASKTTVVLFRQPLPRKSYFSVKVVQQHKVADFNIQLLIKDELSIC